MNWITSLQFEIPIKYVITWPVHMSSKVCELTKALGFWLYKKASYLLVGGIDLFWDRVSVAMNIVS